MALTNISSTEGAGSRVSVIVPVYNGGEAFRSCMKALCEAVPAPKEILVVADGDADGSWMIAEELGAKLLKLEVSSGPAVARNAGAKSAAGDILFFVDADVVVPPDIISKVEDAFNNDPGAAALIGSYDDEPGQTNFLSQYKNLFHHYVHQTSREDASTFWGACGAIRRNVFLDMGGFDPRYRDPSIEDIEFGNRLRRAGLGIRLIKSMQVKHLKRWETISLLKSDFFDRALPWTDLILRNKNFLNDLNLRVSNRISVAFVYVALISAVSAVWWTSASALTLISGISLGVINMPVYRFFLRKRGFWFMIRVVPWHWLYYLYSGLAFAIGVGRFHLRRGE